MNATIQTENFNEVAKLNGLKVPPKTWENVRREYIEGAGSLADLAQRHGLKLSTVERRSHRGQWVKLRQDRENAALAQLVPPTVPLPQASDLSVNEPFSAEWIQERQSAYFIKNLNLVEALRTQLQARLADPEKLDNDTLTKFTASVHTLVEVESRLLGIRDTRRDKPRPTKRLRPHIEVAEDNPA